MSKPVISPVQGHLGVLQGGTILFQPALTAGTVTSWAWAGYPPGCTFSGSTGLLTISPTEAGVFSPTLVASNGDGASDPVTFYVAVEGAGGASTGPDVDVAFDVVSKEVRLLRPAPIAGADDSEGTARDASPQVAAAVAAELARAKAGEDVIFLLHPQKGGAGVDLGAPVSVTATLKEFDTDKVLVTSAAWVKVGTGAAAAYRVRLAIPALAPQLSNYADDTGTRFAGRTEFEITYPAEGAFYSGTFTVNASTNLVTTAAAHGLPVGSMVRVSSGTTLPGGLATATTYFVLTTPAANTMTLSATSGGSVVDIADTGSGTHTLTSYEERRLKSDTFIMTIASPQA